MAAGDRAPGVVRVSFGLYNTLAEVDFLADALEVIAVIAAGRYQGDYVQAGSAASSAPVAGAPIRPTPSASAGRSTA
jgi:hypothetical protein